MAVTFQSEFNIVARHIDEVYRSFINQLRLRIGIGWLPQDEIDRKTQFGILLKTFNNQTMFRFRVDDFCLAGYQMNGKEGKWLEFSDHPQQLIVGSELLGFGGGYKELITTAGCTDLGAVPVSREDLVWAVDTLATTVDKASRAKSLLVVAIMLTGAIRYREIECFLVMFYHKSSTLPFYLQVLLDPQLNCVSSSTAISARNPPRVYKAKSPYRKPQELGEVFSVHIKHTKESLPLWGTIIVSGLSTSCIYNRQEGNPESVGQDGNCTLSGPEFRCILAVKGFTFYLDLRNSAGHKVICDWIYWGAYTEIYNKLLTQTVSGEDGTSATVSYKVYPKAVQADVAVLLRKKGRVHGVVTASNADSQDVRLLFKRNSMEDAIEVQDEGEITLLRSVLAVPLGTQLRVGGTLYISKAGRQNKAKRAKTQGVFHVSPPCPVVANGFAVFASQSSGSDVKCLPGGGSNSEILVRVTWTVDW